MVRAELRNFGRGGAGGWRRLKDLSIGEMVGA